MNLHTVLLIIFILLLQNHQVSSADAQCHDFGTILTPGQCFSLCNATQTQQLRSFKDFSAFSMGFIVIDTYMTLKVSFANDTVLILDPAPMSRDFETDLKDTTRVSKLEICYRAGLAEPVEPIRLDIKTSVRFLGTTDITLLSITSIAHFILAVVAMVLVILIIVFSQKQPLKSRGGLPIFNLLFLICKLGCAQVLNWLTLPFQKFVPVCFIIFMCLMHVYSQFSLLSNHLRYLVLVRMTKSKVFLTQSRGVENPGLRYFVQFLKIVNSIYVFLIVQSFILVFIIFLPFISSYAYKSDIATCSALIQGVSYIGVVVTIYLLNVLLYFGILIVDGFSNVKNCKPKAVLVTGDPHYFRIEFLMYILHPIFVILAVAMLIIAILLSEGNADLPASQESILYVFTSSILIPDVYICAIMTGFPLIITIYRVCKLKNTPQSNELERILADDEMRQSFKVYSEAEFSVENFLCYDEVQVYKKSPTEILAKHIYSTYLVSRAPVEVNIQRKSATGINEKIHKGEFVADLFDEIVRDLVLNMSDTYSRWFLTDDAKAFRQKFEMIEKI